MTAIHEIAPDLFRISIYVSDFDMQFNHFLVRGEEPLAVMHGSSFIGQGDRLLTGPAGVIKDNFDQV